MSTTMPAGPTPRLSPPEWAGLAVLVLAAGFLGWASDAFPAAMPDWAPWDYSWPEFIATALPLWWYARGLSRGTVAGTAPAARPGVARTIAFATGTLLIYAVLQTHFEYMAQHMFFLNRLQHLAMHHLGPFLIALSWPGETIARGMPEPARRALRGRPVRSVLRVVQHPLLAGGLFVGLIDLWLIPAVHFDAMISHRLYDVMNWSMVIDGLLFWFLILDPRPAPAARVSYAARMVTVVAVMFPQIMLGSYLTFTNTDLYTFYDLCGRLFPSLGALNDQHIGGVIVWIPASMMSSAAFMLILNHVRRNEEARPAAEMTAEERHMAALAARWTGRP